MDYLVPRLAIALAANLAVVGLVAGSLAISAGEPGVANFAACSLPLLAHDVLSITITPAVASRPVVPDFAALVIASATGE